MDDTRVTSVLDCATEYRRLGGEPRYLLVDATTYTELRHELMMRNLEAFAGLTVIVVPVPSMLAVVGAAWREALRGDHARA